MYKVTVPQQCGCFRRSGKDALSSFASKDEALVHATQMARVMNDEFCDKHNFNVVEDKNDFVILMNAKR